MIASLSQKLVCQPLPLFSTDKTSFDDAHHPSGVVNLEREGLVKAET